MNAAYVFRVRFRLAPAEGVRVDPREFETVLRLPAAEPGEDGWLFFRDSLWRGNANDERHLRDRFEEALGVPVAGATFRELETDEAYLDALKSEIGRDLSRFNADDVAEVLHKYLGSSIRVTSS
ncbi:LWR-salt protein [Halegenticoccus soli]|uniref:LWR-salt protein n=1 Tax=Halegenticoccus soli TaxID=1985678 RepID=UPI000C6EDA1B|nr:LWR-salt protein [Halegenticoccus soli]